MRSDKIKEINEYRRKKKKSKNTFKFLWFLVFLIIILLIIIFFYIYGNIKIPLSKLTYPFMRSQEINKKEVFANSDNIKYNYGVYKNDIILCSKDGIMAINDDGKDEWTVSFTVNKPLLSCVEDYILVADENGREINLLNNFSNAQNVILDNEIVTSKLNSAGYLSVITDEKGYKGKVTVFNKDLEEIFIWHSVDNRIIDSDVSNDGKFLVVSIINSDKNHVSGGIMYFDLTQSKPKAAIDTDDNIIMNVDFVNSHIVGIGDKRSIVLSESGIVEWTYEYENMNLVDFDKDEENNLLVIGLTEEKQLISGENSKLLIYNVEEKDSKNYFLECPISNIDIKDKLILYNSKQNIVLMNVDGYEIINLEYEKDIQDTVLFDNKSQILIITKHRELDMIEFYNKRLFKEG